MYNNKLHILWTNDNPITAELMVVMYATNAMKYKMWENITVIIWGRQPLTDLIKGKENLITI